MKAEIINLEEERFKRRGTPEPAVMSIFNGQSQAEYEALSNGIGLDILAAGTFHKGPLYSVNREDSEIVP